MKRFRRMMIPYFIFSFSSFLYWCFLELKFRPIHDSNILPGTLSTLDWRIQQFLNIFIAFSQKDAFLYNVVLWFLPCLFVSTIVYISIQKILTRYAVLGVIGLAMIPFIFPHIMLPWCAELALIALPFIYLGRLLYINIQHVAVAVAVGGILGLSLYYIFKPHVDMRTHEIGEWWLFYSVALTLISTLIIFSKYLVGRDYNILQWLGRNSLAIMCMHEPIKRIMLVVLSKCSGLEVSTIRESIIMSIVITVSVVAILIPIIMAINKYIPYVVGIDNYKK